MAAQNGADQGSDAASTETPKPPARTPDDELLCTICGLTACWTAPAKTPAPAAAPEGSGPTPE